MLKRTIALELGKALKNKLFFAAVIIGCVIVGINACIEAIDAYVSAGDLIQIEEHMGIQYNMGTYLSPYSRWVGVEGYSISASILYFVFPLLVCIPYGWSYCMERNSGYEVHMVLRCGKRVYFGAKYIGTFVSGGLTMFIPLVLQFLFFCLVYPLHKPLSSEMIYLGVFPANLFSWKFYTNPVVYVALVCLINFIICGLLACLCFSIALFIKKVAAVTLCPFALLVGLRYIQQLFFTSETIWGLEINPMYYLNGMRAKTNYQVVGFEIVILLLVTLGLVFTWGKNHEIF